MNTILIATRNPFKRRLFEPVFAAYGFEVRDLYDMPGGDRRLPEGCTDVLANAEAKARFYHSPKHLWVFGDDAGLEIDALGGEPGVQARRWGGRFTEDVDDQAWLNYLLQRMAGVAPEGRTARFVAGWALIDPSGTAHTRRVEAPFCIAEQPLRPISPGSPISAVRIGQTDDLACRQAEIRAEWEAWGILEELKGKR